MSFIRTNRYIRLNRAIREGLMDALYDSTIGRTYNPTEYRALYQLKQVLENFPQILPPEELDAAAAEEDEFGGDNVAVVAAQMDTAKENARIDDYLKDVKTELLNNLKFYRETGEVGELTASFEESAAESITNYRLQKEVNVVEFKEV